MPPKKYEGIVKGGSLETDPLYLFYGSLYSEKKDSSPMATEWLRKRDLLPKKEEAANKVQKSEVISEKTSRVIDIVKKKTLYRGRKSFRVKLFCENADSSHKTTTSQGLRKRGFSLSKFKINKSSGSSDHQ